MAASKTEGQLEVISQMRKFQMLPGRDYIKRFLDSKSYSPDSVRNLASIIYRFLKLARKHPKDVILDDWDNFIARMNEDDGVNYASKKTARANLHRFFKSVKYYAWRTEKIPLDNPIPELEFAGIEADTTEKIEKSKERADRKRIPVWQLKAILDAARKTDFVLYLMLLILTHCGMRVNEMLTVKWQDVHLDERWLETGFEPRAKKSNKDGKRRIIYIFHPCVKYALWEYQLAGHGGKWLFPQKHGKRHYSSGSLDGRIRTLCSRLGFSFSSHNFRHTLNSERRYTMKCPKEDRQQLLNHVVKDAITSYDHAQIVELRDLYDKYHPYPDLE